jgi:hypothetical protein
MVLHTASAVLQIFDIVKGGLIRPEALRRFNLARTLIDKDGL